MYHKKISKELIYGRHVKRLWFRFIKRGTTPCSELVTNGDHTMGLDINLNYLNHSNSQTSCQRNDLTMDAPRTFVPDKHQLLIWNLKNVCQITRCSTVALRRIITCWSFVMRWHNLDWSTIIVINNLTCGIKY